MPRRDDELDAADAQPVSFLQAGTLDPLAIHERAVGAFEIVDLRVQSRPRVSRQCSRDTRAASTMNSAPDERPMVLMLPGRMRKVNAVRSLFVGLEYPHDGYAARRRAWTTAPPRVSSVSRVISSSALIGSAGWLAPSLPSR